MDPNTKIGYNSVIGYNTLGQNYGYLINKAPQNVLEELGQQINELKSNFNKGLKHNKYLAGEIEHEYLLHSQPQTKQYIKELAQQFENESQYISANYDHIPTLEFQYLWVNFQKKYEYNPIHRHGGVHSFVIWYQVPYTLEDERNQFGYKPDPTQTNHGQFHFIHSPMEEIEIEVHPLYIDKSKEGYVAIFPSSLNHIVYPFYSSDEYRITVSGNVSTRNP